MKKKGNSTNQRHNEWQQNSLHKIRPGVRKMVPSWRTYRTLVEELSFPEPYQETHNHF